MSKKLNVETRKALVSTKAVAGTKAANTLRNLIRLAVNNGAALVKLEREKGSIREQLARAFRDYCGKGWETAEGSSSQGMKRDAMVKELYEQAKAKNAGGAARKMMFDVKAFAANGYKAKVRGKGINKGRKPGERDAFPMFFEKNIRPLLVRYYTDSNATDKDERAMEYVRMACVEYGLDISKEMQMSPKPEKTEAKAKAKAKAK
jgi:hypothetical protein